MATDFAARTLEAMRLGVVPDSDIRPYTVGREAAMATVAQDLSKTRDEGGGVRVFLGDYGSGKTHLLHLAAQQALQENFVVASVILDAHETSPSHPQRVYRSLVRSLRYPDRVVDTSLGLSPLLDAALKHPKIFHNFGLSSDNTKKGVEERLASGYHLYLSPALQYWKVLADPKLPEKLRRDTPDPAHYIDEAHDLLISWLEGHPTLSNNQIGTHLGGLPTKHLKLYGMCDYRPWARIYGYILSGLAALAHQVGYAGLVVLVDEAEFYALLSSENKNFARVLFMALTCAATPPSQDVSWPSDIEIGGAGIQKTLPPRYTSPDAHHAPLYLALAMTPASDGLSMLSNMIEKSHITDLPPLAREHYLSLSRLVAEFYASANPTWPIPVALTAPIGKLIHGLIDTGHLGNPRQAMKFIIEFLDIIRHRPDAAPRMIKDIQNLLA